MCTISLTSLPGPAPHCRPGYVEYRPPETWIDIVTSVGPIYGNFKSCGDLIFSGHMAFSTTAVLLYLRVLDRYHTGFSRTRWVVGAIYLIGLSALLLAGRKHYTVDVVLGVLIASLSYLHFEHGWIPLAIEYQYPDGLIAYRARHKLSADTANSIDFMSLDAIEISPKLPIRNRSGWCNDRKYQLIGIHSFFIEFYPISVERIAAICMPLDGAIENQ